MDHSWVLSAIVILPLLGSALAVLLGSGRLVQAWLAPAILETCFLLGLWLFGLTSGGQTVEVPVATGQVLGQQFSLFLAADGLVAVFVVLVSAVGLANTLFRAGEMERSSRSATAMLLLSVGLVSGVLTSGNLLTLYALWQLAVIALSLANVAGAGARSPDEAFRFFLTGEVAALLILVAVGLTYATGEVELPWGWQASDASTRLAVTALLAAAALLAVAVSPFRQGSLTDGAAADPASGPFLLGIQNQAGLYVLARTVAVATAAGPTEPVADLLAVVGALMVVLASAGALAQREARALVAFLAMAQTGLMLLGFGTGERIGLAGALFLVVGQTLALLLMLLALELVRRRLGSGRSDGAGGLARELPLAAVGFTVGALSLVGMPPWSGFVGQMLVYQGLASRSDEWGLIAAASCLVGGTLTATALVRFGGRVFLGQRSLPGHVRPPDLLAQTSVAALLVAVVAIGLLPRLVLDPVVSPVAGVAFAGSWADLAVVPAPGHEPVNLWHPLLSSMLIVLPLAVLTLSRAPLRRPVPAAAVPQAATVAAPAKEASSGGAVPPPAETSSLMPVSWRRTTYDSTAADKLDPLFWVQRLVMLVARLAAAGLRVCLQLLLR